MRAKNGTRCAPPFSKRLVCKRFDESHTSAGPLRVLCVTRNVYIIFDAGCGMGRNSYFALKYGAKSVLAIDNNFFVKFIIVCPTTDNICFVSNILFGGFDLSKTLVGLLKLLKKNIKDIINAKIVACWSPCLTPCKYNALNEYAETKQLIPNILYICIVVANVLRP